MHNKRNSPEMNGALSFVHGISLVAVLAWSAAADGAPRVSEKKRPQVVHSKPDCGEVAARSKFHIKRESAEKAVKIAREMVDRGFAPGVVMLVEQSGRVVVDATYGFADLDEKRPMQRDSLFRIFSMTKPVTSVAALQLVAEGKLSLDDPVSKYLPEFANTRVWKSGTNPAETEALERPILVRDLLLHSAGFGYGGDTKHPVLSLYEAQGIPTGPGIKPKPIEGVAEIRSTAELALGLSKIPLLNQPGSRFTYGHATDLLGRVVEVSSGQRLQDFIGGSILKPLAMTSSGFQVAPGKRGYMTTAYAGKSQASDGASVLTVPQPSGLKPAVIFPVDKWNASPLLKPAAIDFGGAGMVSTAGDYLKFTQMLRNGGKYKGKRVVPAELAVTMMTNQLASEVQVNAPLLDGMGFGYGMAVRLQPTSDVPVFPRCGAFWGGAASTFFWIDRENEISGVFMTQVFGGDVKSFWLETIRQLYDDKPDTGHN